MHRKPHSLHFPEHHLVKGMRVVSTEVVKDAHLSLFGFSYVDCT